MSEHVRIICLAAARRVGMVGYEAFDAEPLSVRKKLRVLRAELNGHSVRKEEESPVKA